MNCQLYSIRKIRKYLDEPMNVEIINPTVASRFDYCNSLLHVYDTNGYLVSQLQFCQENAARIISLRQKNDHVTPLLEKLHWPYLSGELMIKSCCCTARLNMAWPRTTRLRYYLEFVSNCCWALAAPYIYQTCPVSWNFQRHSEYTLVLSCISKLQLDILLCILVNC